MRWMLYVLSLPALFAANPELVKVKAVYLLPMANGMDQYLANHLLKGSPYVVVSDPNHADAVFTDKLGPSFERKMTELYPPDDEEEVETPDHPSSSFRRGQGMVFLVERKSRQVVWSVYERPKDFRPDSLDKTARRIADQLKKDLVAKIP